MTGTPATHGADRACRRAPRRRGSAPAVPALGAADRDSADERHARRVSFSALQQSAGRKRERVGEEGDEVRLVEHRGSRRGRRSPSSSTASAWNVSISAPGRDAAHTATAAPSSTSRSRADDALGGAAEQVARRELLAHDRSAACAASARWAGERKTKARSTGRREPGARLRARRHGPRARVSGSVESPAPILLTSLPIEAARASGYRGRAPGRPRVRLNERGTCTSAPVRARPRATIASATLFRPQHPAARPAGGAGGALCGKPSVCTGPGLTVCTRIPRGASSAATRVRTRAGRAWRRSRGRSGPDGDRARDRDDVDDVRRRARLAAAAGMRAGTRRRRGSSSSSPPRSAPASSSRKLPRPGMPALFTSRCTAGWRSRDPCGRPPRPALGRRRRRRSASAPISAATRSRRSRPRARRTQRQPRSASRRAVAAPMPLEPPVTTATANSPQRGRLISTVSSIGSA